MGTPASRRVAIGCALWVATAASATGIAGGRAVPPPGATIRGRVTSMEGRAVARAEVRLTSIPPAVRQTVTTGAAGTFEFKDLPAGTYSLRAAAEGFVPVEWGQFPDRESGRTITLTGDQIFREANLILPRGAVVAGTVVDETGEAVDGVPVYVLRSEYAAGFERVSPVASSRRASDDRGRFRVFGLPAGEYYVLAAPGSLTAGVAGDDDELAGYVPTFYPGTAGLTGAARIRIAPGQEISQLVIQLVASRMWRIAGTVVSPENDSAAGVELLLMPYGGDRLVAISSHAVTKGDGRFTFATVPPGQYLLQALPDTSDDGRFASVALDVSSDVDGLALQLRQGRTIRGDIRIDESALPATDSHVQIRTRAVDFSQSPVVRGSRVTTHSDGTFEIADVWGRHVIQVTDLPEGQALKSITLGGVDVTDQPIDVDRMDRRDRLRVLLTSQITEVSGVVLDRAGHPARHAVVLAFADSVERWEPFSRLTRQTVTDDEGQFTISGLPAGVYRAVGLSGLPDRISVLPEFLRVVRVAATRVSLREHEQTSLELRLVPDFQF